MQIKALQTLHKLGGEYMDAAEHRSLMQKQLKQLSKPPAAITAADIDAEANASSDNTSIDEVQVVDKPVTTRCFSFKTTKSIRSPTTSPSPEKTPPPCHYCHVKVAYLCYECESRSICHRCSSEHCGNKSMKGSDAICEACFNAKKTAV
jgi:hypothetical protein